MIDNSFKLGLQEQRINSGFNRTSSQLAQIAESVFDNKKQMDILNVKMSKVLDKLEQEFPEKKKDIDDTRNFLQKLNDGLFKENSVMTGYFTVNAILRIEKTLTASGEPTLMTFGAGLIAIALGVKTVQNFNKGYNGGNSQIH